MAAMFGMDLFLELLVGQFPDFDASTELVQSRNMVPIPPHGCMRHLMAEPLTLRQLWKIVGKGIISHNNEAG
jgi:hypothetical protein